MKVTNDEVIRNGEQELIDGITADLDWEAVEKLFMERHRLPLGEDVSYKRGDLVVHENRIAYLLEFEVKVPLAMLLDREGDCISIRAVTSAELENPNSQDPEDCDTPPPEEVSPAASEDPADSAGPVEASGM